MPTTAIPAWTAEGVLPPLDEANPLSPSRAPYPVSLADLVARFATSPQRCEVLAGFMAYRAALHANGYLAGFQWLDGSFMEDVETIQGRAVCIHPPPPTSGTCPVEHAADLKLDLNCIL